GVYITSGTGTTNITNNVLGNLYAGATAGAGFGIYFAPGASSNHVIANNYIQIPQHICVSGSGINMAGIYANSGSNAITCSVYGNRIDDNLYAVSGDYAYGIWMNNTGGDNQTWNVYNNQISMRNPNGNSGAQVIGIIDNMRQGTANNN